MRTFRNILHPLNIECSELDPIFLRFCILLRHICARIRTYQVLLTVHPILRSFGVTLIKSAYEEFHGVRVPPQKKRSSDPRFHQICSACYLLTFQDPAARNKMCSACFLSQFQGPEARNLLFRILRMSIRYMRKRFREERRN